MDMNLQTRSSMVIRYSFDQSTAWSSGWRGSAELDDETHDGTSGTSDPEPSGTELYKLLMLPFKTTWNIKTMSVPFPH